MEANRNFVSDLVTCIGGFVNRRKSSLTPSPMNFTAVLRYDWHFFTSLKFTGDSPIKNTHMGLEATLSSACAVKCHPMKVSKCQLTTFLAAWILWKNSLEEASNLLERCTKTDSEIANFWMKKTLKKHGEGAHDHRVDNAKCLAVVRWFDRKAVTLVSNFVSGKKV